VSRGQEEEREEEGEGRREGQMCKRDRVRIDYAV